MRTGKLTELVVPSGWNRLFTVPQNENGTISINLCTITGAAVTFRVAHVKQGNAGAISRADKDSIASPGFITTGNVAIIDMGVDSLDDIYINASIGSELVASINTEGLQYSTQQQR